VASWQFVFGGVLLMTCAGGRAHAAGEVNVDRLVHELDLPADAAARVDRGEIVVSTPPPASARELAVGLTFFVPRPLREVLAAFWSAVDMRADWQLRAIGVLRGSRDDFASVVVPPAEARRYVTVRPGDAVNLSSDEIGTFNALATAGGAAATTEALRGVLFARYRAYLAGGLRGIAPYARSGGGTRSPAEELLAAAEATPVLRHYAPLAWTLLHSYPDAKPAALDERFYVLTYELDGRPNFVLRHRIAVPSTAGWSWRTAIST
jgi:hypothetical protein